MSALRVPRKKWHGDCIYRIREVTSPIHKQFKGYRLEVAVPNMNGHKAYSSEPAPSFSRAHLLFQSSDWGVHEVEQKATASIMWLENRGFEKVEPAEIYSSRMLLQMSKRSNKHNQSEDEYDFS